MVLGYVNRWFEEKKILMGELTEEQKMLENFFDQIYVKRETKLTDDELQLFEKLREDEAKDYKFRKFIWWPCYISGLLLFDHYMIMDITKTNFQRGFLNIVFGMPFVAIVMSGVVFYRKGFESHRYANELCQKYGLYSIEFKEHE